MLKRNKILVAFMLVAVLCMAIGFASVSDTLNVSGGITLNLGSDSPLVQEFDGKVKFTNAIADTASSTVSSTAGVKIQLTNDNDRVRIDIDNTVFTEVGQKVVVVCTIENGNVQKAMLKNFTSSLKENVGKCMTVEWAFKNGGTSEQSIDGNGTTTLTCTITLVNLPTGDVVSENDAFTCQFDAVPVIE